MLGVYPILTLFDTYYRTHFNTAEISEQSYQALLSNMTLIMTLIFSDLKTRINQPKIVY